MKPLIYIKGKKGTSHVEMILSIVIFVGFLIFLFTFFNPFKTSTYSSLVESVFFNIQDQMQVKVSRVSLSLSNIAIENIQNDGKGCFSITGTDIQQALEDLGCTTNINIRVMDKDNLPVDADINNPGTCTKIDIDRDGSSKFYTVYLSDIFSDLRHDVEECTNLNNGEGVDYELGLISEQKYWSDKKLVEFKDKSYNERKQEVLGGANDFKLSVYDTQRNLILKYEPPNNLKYPEPSFGVRVDAREFPVDVVDSEAVIKKIIINIQIW